MSSKTTLNEIYKLYSDGKYPEAAKQVQDILAVEPNNPYAKRYQALLKPYLQDKSQVGKIQTVKGKKLTCPHCESAIALSALSEGQKLSIRNNEYSNLEIKCPYCHTKFILQKKSSNSLLGIKVGESLNYEGKKYRVTGSVNYAGTWSEGRYAGDLSYLEWILLGDDNSYLYFSEGYFEDDGQKTYEFEFSEKIVPEFSIDPDFSGGQIALDGSWTRISERNNVRVTKLYGENSKMYSVGERVELYEFSYKGTDYVLEREKAGRQSESGIYQTKSVSKKEACRIFNKPYEFSFSESNVGNKISDIAGWGVFGLVFLGGMLQTFFEKFGIILVFVLVGAIIVFVLYRFLAPKLSTEKIHLIVAGLVVGPIFGIFIVPVIANLFFDQKQLVSLADIKEGKKYQIEFQTTENKKQEVVKRRSYDYGGVKTTYKERTGLQFSVEDKQDTKTIDALQEIGNSTTELRDIFKEPIYKLK